MEIGIYRIQIGHLGRELDECNTIGRINTIMKLTLHIIKLGKSRDQEKERESF